MRTAELTTEKLASGAVVWIVKVSGRREYGGRGYSVDRCIGYMAGRTRRSADDIRALAERGLCRIKF